MGRNKFLAAVAIAALAATTGGAIAAASSGGGTVIHACANSKTGALRELKGKKCGRGARSLSWNQQGPIGPPGAAGPRGANGQNGQNGATNLTSRSTTGSIAMTCAAISPGNYLCNGLATTRASCQPGERATGGGYGQAPGGMATVSETRPDPASGTPTGWAVTATAIEASSTPSVPPVQYTVYVVCAAP
ncbi:MAG TPA: hypothetical protein VKR21_02810 [Solirubrobacteraceae bacterium]|nr:hypothetical protein [Solirubrobacteraceae bacterium]